jgi:hypothetical protein
MNVEVVYVKENAKKEINHQRRRGLRKRKSEEKKQIMNVEVVYVYEKAKKETNHERRSGLR